jgi:hypothetical protein
MPNTPTRLKSALVFCLALAGLNLSASAQSPAQGENTAPQASSSDTSNATLVPPSKQEMLTAKVERKRSRMAVNAARANAPAFAFPQEAINFYVNKRTGPIITRGPDITTGSRGLDPQAYFDALALARNAPARSVKTGAIMNSGAEVAAAAAGGLLSTWQPLGPNNQGGRTRQLLIDPGNPNIMYAAAVGGGVWKTLDGGANWNPLTDLLLPNIAVASLAMDPKNSQVLYAGTGEGVFNVDAIRGTGIFKTTDGGATWSAVASTIPAPGVAGDFSYVYNIVVSSRSSQRLYASTRTGFFRSNDGGGSWIKLIDAAALNGCHDIVMQTKRALGYVFVACGTFSTADAAIYRGYDGPATAFTSAFTVPNMGRTSLAIAPSNESYVYALASHKSTYGMLGVYRSTANGNSGSWTTQVDANAPTKLNRQLLTNPVFAFLTECNFGASANLNQGWYDNVIAVDPIDPERVWAGGVDLLRSDDGGKNWGVASYWWFRKDVDPQYAHADNHVIRFHPGYDGVSNKKMFVASDGGVFRTDDARAAVGKTVASVCGNPVAGAVTWTELNNNYTTTQFYHGAVYPDGNAYFGGLQDNGTLRGSTASSSWQVLRGGDGAYNALDTLGDANPGNDVLFLANTGLSIQKSTNGGANFALATSGITGTGHLFIAPFFMNPGNRQQLWSGGFDVWRTTNQATSWQRVGGQNATPGLGSVSAFAASALNPNKVLVGMSDGFISYTSTGLTRGSADNDWGTFSTQPRAAFVSSLAFDPTNDTIAYATYTTFLGSSVYRSTNSGATWTAIQGTGANVLPRVPAHTVAVDPTNPTRLYVGTDIGVYTSIDSGANWYREVAGFGNVSVEHLEINTTGTKRLFAFTHGRGVWRVDLTP